MSCCHRIPVRSPRPLVLLLMLAAGCTAAPARYEIPPTHAASPHAAEAPLPPAFSAMTPGSVSGGSSSDTQPPAGAEPAPSQPATYTCPMHADVRRDAPGRCPQCGMELVPAQAHDHGGTGP